MRYTRRELGQLALGSMAMTAIGRGVLEAAGAQPAAARPGSTFGGVPIGVISWSFRQVSYDPLEVLKLTRQLGIGIIELENAWFEPFLGAPAATLGAGRGMRPAGSPAGPPPSGTGGAPAPGAGAPPAGDAPGRGQGGGGRGAPLTPEQEAAQKVAREELRQWRLNAPMDKVRALRKLYDDGGVTIQFVKWSSLDEAFTDAELDYAFTLAKTIGARGITTEPPLSATKRLGRFADKHKMLVAYHNHTNVTSVEAFGRTGAWEQAFFYSPNHRANVDLGHFTSGNAKPPTDFIREYHARIASIHLKDRKFNGPNVPWGQGDTPIKEILQMIKREKYKITPVIELEYQIPAGSTVMEELAKCVQFCRDALA